MKSFFSSLIQALLQKHPILTPLILAGFLFGIGFGAVCARSLDKAFLEQTRELFLQAKSDSFFELFLQTLLHSVLPLFLLQLCAWSAIGVPGCCLISALRGFSTGFTLCFAVRQWAKNGILFVLATQVPRILAEIPVFLLFAICSAGISGQLFQSLWKPERHDIHPLSFLLLFFILVLFGLLFGLGLEYLQQAFIENILTQN